MQTKIGLFLSALLLFWSPAAFSQTTWIVDQGGGGDFTTVQSCVDAAAAGDTCQVNAATYNESVTIMKALTLIGPDGPDTTIIRSTSLSPVSIFGSGTVVLHGLSLRNGITFAGGGLYIEGGNVTVRNCHITNNLAGLIAPGAPIGGGGIYLNSSTLTVEDSVIADNEIRGSFVSRPYGGAILAEGGNTLTLTNCLIAGNLAAQGAGAGALFLNASTAKITNCTIVDNEDSPIATGGIWSSGSGGAIVENSILWNVGAEITGTATVTYSDVEGGYTGTGNLDADPLFVGSGDYHLTENSPCVDSGDNTAPSLPPMDLDGNVRPMDGNCDNLFVVDMGAYELFKNCPWPVASTAVPGERGLADRSSSLPINGLLPLFVPLAGLLLWRGFRRNRA